MSGRERRPRADAGAADARTGDAGASDAGASDAGAEPRPLPDHEARRRIREDLDATLFVEAAAGTGKTTALVERLVALVASGRATLPSLVAVTFTEKAAGELTWKLRAGLEEARRAAAYGAAAAALERALAELELARIETIHAFAAELLRERPVEAGVDPCFVVADEEEAERLLDEALGGWLGRALADPPEGVRRVLRRKAGGGDGEGRGARAALLGVLLRLVDHRDFPAPWTRPPLAREAAIDALIERLREVAALAEAADRPGDWVAVSLRRLADWLAELDRREQGRERDHDGLEAELAELCSLADHRWWVWRGGGRTYSRSLDLAKDDVIRRRDEAKAELDALVAALDQDLAALLHRDLQDVIRAYERLKARRGALDFLDLLLRARDLVRDRDDLRAELQQRYTHILVDELQDTDPVQSELLLLLAADDPRERDWRRVRPRAGKLFVVGDPKQSIYRFRRADVAVYLAIEEQLRRAGATVLTLSASFRSVPALQLAINASFARAMGGGSAARGAEGAGGGGSASGSGVPGAGASGGRGPRIGYVALEPVRADPSGQPSLVVLPVPAPYSEPWRSNQGPTLTKKAIERSLPDAVGGFIAWLVRDSGWTVEEGGARVPIAARHVCVLFRRFRSFGEDVTRGYADALEARGVPHVLVGGRSFHAREEVMALVHALTAIEWPDDELSVFATLRGPLFGLDDAQLLAYRARFGGLHPLRRVDVAAAVAAPLAVSLGGGAAGEAGDAGAAGDAGDAAPPDPACGGLALGAALAAAAPTASSAARRGASEGELDDEARSLAAVASALAILGGLHPGRNRRPAADTVRRLVAATRAHAGFATLRGGGQALANLGRLIELAHRFEQGGARSFRAFVERLEAEADRGEAAEAPVVEEGTDGVRMMTTHRAKGLEFPVVVLADPTCSAARRIPGRRVDAARGLWAEPLLGLAPLDLDEGAHEELAADRAEAVRVAYVAATRARDLLVVPALSVLGGEGGEEGSDEAGATRAGSGVLGASGGAGGGASADAHADPAAGDDGGMRSPTADSWLAALHPAIYPALGTHGAPATAPGCPSFGPDSLLVWPEGLDPDAVATVAPGLHRPRAGAHVVVWWDPRALGGGVATGAAGRSGREGGAIALARLLGPGPLCEEGVRAHAAWRDAREAARSAGAIPRLQVESATGRAAAAAGSAASAGSAATAASAAGPTVDVETTALDRAGRPSGTRFGMLVHAALATVDLGAGTSGIADAVGHAARVFGAPPLEREHAVRAVAAALAHPLVRRAAAAERAGWLRREVPVHLRVGRSTESRQVPATGGGCRPDPAANGGAHPGSSGVDAARTSPDGTRSGTSAGACTLVEGVIDLCFREDAAPAGGGPGWVVVDFKTDLDLAPHRSRYARQLALYVEAVSRATGLPTRAVLLAV